MNYIYVISLTYNNKFVLGKNTKKKLAMLAIPVNITLISHCLV